MSSLKILLSCVILSSYVLTACTGNGNKSDSAKDEGTLSELTDSKTNNETVNESEDTLAGDAAGNQEVFNENDLAILRKHFSEASIKELSDLMIQLANVETDSEFARLYNSANELREKMVSETYKKEYYDPYEMMTELQKLDSAMIGFRASCLAECTEFNYTYQLTDFVKIAEKTEGEADDDFFESMVYACGEYGCHDYGWFRFFDFTWDYGGGAVLGDSICYNYLSMSWKAMQESNMFEKYIMKVRSRCISDMSHDIYMKTKDEVMAELNRILEAGILTSDEKDKLEELRTRNEDASQKLQFNCQTMECDFGG